MAAASTMTGSVLGLGALGYFIGSRFESTQIGLLIGALLGVVVGLYELYKSFYIEEQGKK